MQIVGQLVKLCLFRVQPEDLPYSTTLIALLMGLDVLLTLPVSAEEFTWVQLLLAPLLYQGTTALFLHWILTLRRQTNRFVKIFTALLGTHVVFLALVLVLNCIIPSIDTFSTIVIILGFWSLAVYAHIFQYGLGVSKVTAFATAFGFVCAAFFTFALLFEVFHV